MASIWAADKERYADINVWVADKERYADLLVYRTDRSHDAKGEDAIWEFVDKERYATTKVFFVDKERDADLKVFFVDKERYAKWQNGHQLQGQL